MIKILVTGPNSYFSYNLLTKLINKNLDLFIIVDSVDEAFEYMVKNMQK